MATAGNRRTRTALVLVTLLLSAFFVAQGATALLASKVFRSVPEAQSSPSRRALASARARERHDPSLILRRNIFDSAQGDLSNAPLEELALPDADLPMEEVETPCKGSLRLIGTVVIPGELERSLAAIEGSDQNAGLHRGGGEVGEFRIRSIQADSVVLQGKSGFCRLTMFEVEGAAPAKPIPKPRVTERKPGRRGNDADRNAGLSEQEISDGVEKVNDTNFNISRVMLNKVLDNAGKLIGIAAVAPKMEGGQSVGMEIRGIRPGTLLTKLGIQNGDVLENVNGQPLSSPDAALGAYTTLRTADKFNLTVRRGGQSMIINYTLQ